MLEIMRRTLSSLFFLNPCTKSLQQRYNNFVQLLDKKKRRHPCLNMDKRDRGRCPNNQLLVVARKKRSKLTNLMPYPCTPHPPLLNFFSMHSPPFRHQNLVLISPCCPIQVGFKQTKDDLEFEWEIESKEHWTLQKIGCHPIMESHLILHGIREFITPFIHAKNKEKKDIKKSCGVGPIGAQIRFKFGLFLAHGLEVIWDLIK